MQKHHLNTVKNALLSVQLRCCCCVHVFKNGCADCEKEEVVGGRRRRLCYCSSASAEVRLQPPLHHSMQTGKGWWSHSQFSSCKEHLVFVLFSLVDTQDFKDTCAVEAVHMKRLTVLFFCFNHFSRQTVMAEGQLSRPTLPQLPHMPEETNRPTVGSSMCVISADPDALKRCPVTALHCIPRITPYSSLLAVIMGLNSLCHWNATQIKCHQRNNGEVKLNWETMLRMRLLTLRRNRALCSVQCNLISETKASGSGERYITYEQTPSRPESTASLKYHLVAVPFIRDLVQGRKYSLISFIAEAQQCITL